jgi:hypothetical protein
MFSLRVVPPTSLAVECRYEWNVYLQRGAWEHRGLTVDILATAEKKEEKKDAAY